jgi:hypothetical protein
MPAPESLRGRRMKLKTYVFSLLCVATFGAHSQTMSGNDLLQKLTDQNIEGLLYLIGVVDGGHASRVVFESDFIKTEEKTKREALISLGKYWGCRPEKASYGQVSEVTIAYLKSNPKIRHFDSSMLIAAAIREAWPCKFP